MIIRPVCEREYVSLPNVILNDRRLNADTRAMLALVLSKPKSWEVRPMPLAKSLSRVGSKPIGLKALARMFREATAAGYMARSAEQGRQSDGSFGKYIYFIGMPDDVAEAIKSSGVAILPQRPERYAAERQAAEGLTYQKEQNLENPDYKNLSPKPSLAADAEAHEAAGNEELTEFGLAARDQGMVFVFEDSEPYRQWIKFRGADGIPISDVKIIAGIRRRGVWMPTLHPPARRRSAEAAA
jgi:hypothetical protein